MRVFVMCNVEKQQHIYLQIPLSYSYLWDHETIREKGEQFGIKQSKTDVAVLKVGAQGRLISGLWFVTIWF